jgi:calcineurin-like phosphoesterase family protein
MSAYFTSDPHYWHENVIKYCNRPFDSVEEMNEVMISNHNKVVRNNDDIYMLGDICFANTEKTIDILSRLNGRKYLIYGNHDRLLRADAFDKYFVWRKDLAEVKMEKKRFVLMHYAMRTWHKQHRGAIQLYGHSHNNLADAENLLSLDVGVDAHDFSPISFHQVMEVIDRKIKHMEDAGINMYADHHEERD